MKKKHPKKHKTNTRGNILRAAVRVFAKHGYRGATTRMICAEARVNVALVNYHFRSKEGLYKEAIALSLKPLSETLVAIPDTVRDKASWCLAVRRWVRRSLSACAARKTPESLIVQLLMSGADDPFDDGQEINDSFKRTILQSFARLVRMALPEGDPALVGLWCGMVHAQCAVYAFAGTRWLANFCPPDMGHEAWLDRVAEHICGLVFSNLSFKKPGS